MRSLEYSGLQREFYQRQWKRMKPSRSAREIGWHTLVPDPKFLKFLRLWKKIKVRGKALDVGCGSGRHTLALAKAGFDALFIGSTNTQLVGHDQSPRACLRWMV